MDWLFVVNSNCNCSGDLYHRQILRSFLGIPNFNIPINFGYKLLLSPFLLSLDIPTSTAITPITLGIAFNRFNLGVFFYYVLLSYVNVNVWEGGFAHGVYECFLPDVYLRVWGS